MTEDASAAPAGEDGANAPWRLWPRLLVFALVAAGIVALYFASGERLSLEYLAEQESRLRELRQEAPLRLFGGAFVLYVVVTGASVPGASVLTLTYAWLFGFLPTLLLVSFASTTGATIAFLLSRFLFRDFVQRRFGRWLGVVNEALEREGVWYLLTLRLLPAMPFVVINPVMGLTPMRVRTYWWVTQLGMLPGTFLYAWAGSSFPSLRELAEEGASSLLQGELLAAFTVLAILPLATRWAVARWRKPRGGAHGGTTGGGAG